MTQLTLNLKKIEGRNLNKTSPPAAVAASDDDVGAIQQKVWPIKIWKRKQQYFRMKCFTTSADRFI